MNLQRLVRRQVHGHPVRSLLTVGAVTVAVFLFCFLQSILSSLEAAVEASAANRVIVTSAVSLFQYLPRTYLQTIGGMEGVESVGPFSWFGGRYRDEGGFFAQFGVDPETFFRQYPEVDLPEAEKQAFVADRRGAIVGADLAAMYGWGVGQDVPLLTSIFARVDGREWTFTIRGIYRSTRPNVDESTLYFQHDYLQEVVDRDECYGPRGTGAFVVEVADGHRGEEVATLVDRYFDGGPQRTRTQTEAAFQADFVNMLGNLPTFLGMIVGAILFAILFGVVNTMTIAARERTRTVGILKALGFADRVPARMYVFEAFVLTAAGAALGMALAVLSQETVRRMLGSQIPMYAVASDTLVRAALLAVAIALLAGGIPAWRARALRPVEALRLEG